MCRPGFLPTPGLFGLADFGAPGLPFVLGSQDGNIAQRAAQAGWLSPSTVQNAPFTQAITKRFLASTTLEPFRDFRINVTANYNRSDNYQEFYRPSATGAGFSSQAPIRNGSYSMSYFSFGTTFERLRADNTSPIFDKFEAYRDILQLQESIMAAGFEIIKTENLCTFDGQPAFSAGQGA